MTNSRYLPRLLALAELAFPSFALAQIIKVDGSSTVYPVTEAVAEEFQTANKIKVTVGISGTGGGFKKFVRGEIDVQNASRPILADEMAQARANRIEFIELPICFDALNRVLVRMDLNPRLMCPGGAPHVSRLFSYFTHETDNPHPLHWQLVP